MRRIAIIFAGLCLFAAPAQARPVSYPGGWTVMVKNDVNRNSLHVHYTLDRKHSLGLRVRHDRDRDFIFTGVQANRLIKRWNKPDSQANIYGRIAIGQAFDNLDASELRFKRDDDEALFLGLSGDWETRRYFISGAAEYWDNGRFGDFSSYHSRVGIAPYVGNTGALHTWFMLEGHHRPDSRNNKTSATALVRFFKGPALLEVGIDDRGEPLLNYIHRF